MQRIGFIVFPGFQVMSFAAVSVFEFANLTAGEPLYDVHILSEAGGPVRSSVGMTVETAPFGDAPVRHHDRRRRHRADRGVARPR